MAELHDLDPERNMLAAEFALGLLTGEELVAAEKLYREDAAFAAEVDVWLREGVQWIDSSKQARVPHSLYARVAVALGLDRDSGSPQEETPIRSPSAPWKPLALAASAAALAFGGLWLFGTSPLAPDSERPGKVAGAEAYPKGSYSVAQISSQDAASLVTALYDNDTGTLYVRLADIPDPERVPQLWLLDQEGTPRSLGFGTRGARSEIRLAPDQRAIASEGGTLAISLEEPAETPHAAPSDVVGAAQLARLD